MQTTLNINTMKAINDFTAKIPAIYAKFEYAPDEERAACLKQFLSDIFAIHKASLETIGKKEGDLIVINGKEVTIGNEKTIRNLVQKTINQHTLELSPSPRKDIESKTPQVEKVLSCSPASKALEKPPEQAQHTATKNNSSTSSIATSQLRAPLPTEKEFGNKWLMDQLKATGDDSTRNVFALVLHALKSHDDKKLENFERLFPDRTISKERVEMMSIDELKNLRPVDFFAIIDLISGEKAMALIQTDLNINCKMGLYFLNKEIGKTFASCQKTLYETPISAETQEQASNALRNFRKYQTDEMLKHPNYKKMDEERMNRSNSCKDPTLKARWDASNKMCWENGLPQSINIDFIVNLNNALRLDRRRPPECQAPMGLRHVGNEVLSNREDGNQYLPGRQVEKEMEGYLFWLNERVEACKNGVENPIILAAEAYQRFVSIHPFTDGNGRTGRLLADLILRDFGILPVAWKDENVSVYPVDREGTSRTPDQAVKQILEGLKRSYEFYQD